MLTLVGFSFFCALTLGAPDASLLSNQAKIQVPFANTEISFVAFLFIGPLTLIGLAAYLHIFLSHWQKLHRTAASGLPFLFNLDSRVASAVSNLVFYWLTPLVLAGFAWKALPRPESPILILVWSLVTATSVLFLLRRDVGELRRWQRTALWLVILGVSLAGFGGKSIPRRVVLAPQIDLNRADLRGWSMAGWVFFQAKLSGADLRGVDLWAVTLGTRERLDGACADWLPEHQDLWLPPCTD